MSKKGYIHFTIVLDGSASIYKRKLKDGMIAGINGLIGNQLNADGTATVTLIIFSSEIDIREENIPINRVKILTDRTYLPRNQSSLLDAIGTGITSTDTYLENLPQAEEPEAVVFLIASDCVDNSSSNYPIESVEEAIKDRVQINGWEFILLGINPNAKRIATKIGISENSTLQIEPTEPKLLLAFNSTDQLISSYRKIEITNCHFTPEDQARQE